MQNDRIQLLFNLYLFGRRIKEIAKHQNYDLICQAAILNLLSKKSLTVSEISTRLSTKISATSEKLISLEKKGLIRKTKGGDKRSIKLYLNLKGENMIKRMQSSMEDHCLRIFDQMTVSELDELSKIINKLLIATEKKIQ